MDPESATAHPPDTTADGTTEPTSTTGPTAMVAAAEPPPADEPADEPPPIVPVDMTPAAAPALCADLVPTPETLQRSEFRRGGIALPANARADVLECHYSDDVNGDVVTAYLVVRSAGEEEVTTEELGQAFEVPGMASSYRLGRLERTPSGCRIRVTGADTYYGDTGDPDSSGAPEVDSAVFVFTCTLNAEYQLYDCERN
jgi:hypothetical protein